MLSRLNKTEKFSDNSKKRESKLATVDPLPSSTWVNTNLSKILEACYHLWA